MKIKERLLLHLLVALLPSNFDLFASSRNSNDSPHTYNSSFFFDFLQTHLPAALFIFLS